MKKKQYETPQVELMECRVERGFAGSGYGGNNTEGSNDGTEGIGDSGNNYEWN